MLEEIIKNPELDRYLTHFDKGQILFLEGDDSQDLFILVSGQLDIIKGNKKIAEISKAGDLFGEMSFLLGARRTATVKAKSEGKTICIPEEDITSFVGEFPDVATAITRLLAQRLEETSQILFGLKEFCDQLPDAVILTGRDGNILTWNTVAEKMYGRAWDQMRYRSVEDIYEEPKEYKNFLEEVQSRYSVREKILKIRHPENGTRYISTSTTVLYDGHHNFQGVLSLGRDVTSFKKMEKRYHRARYWVALSLILLGLLATGMFLGYQYVVQDSKNIDVKKQGLRSQLGKDFLLLKSLLVNHFMVIDRPKTGQLMKEFINIQGVVDSPYKGLVFLDRDKKVFDAYSIKDGSDTTKLIDSSYAGIEFQGNAHSLNKALTLYRADKNHPMGQKGIEIAFEINGNGDLLGWLVFQMDMDLLKDKYGVNEEDLKGFQFKKP